jgi:hypothetical protein
MEDFSKIKTMINSSHGDTVYLASKLLKGDKFLGNKEAAKLFNQIPLNKRIKTYLYVCKELNVKELTISDFNFLPEDQQLKALCFHKLKNIEKLFNGKWKIDWEDSTQNKYYPWFREEKAGLVFYCSGCYSDDSGGSVAYFKDRDNSDFVGKIFINLYEILIK